MSTAEVPPDTGQDRAAGKPRSAGEDGSAGALRRARHEKIADWISVGVLIGTPVLSFALSYRYGECGHAVGAFGSAGASTRGAAFPWAIVGELAFVVYAYSEAIRRKEYRAVFVSLAVWLGEMIWEMVNGVWRHFYGYPWFGFDGQTAWQMYPGLTIEISLMFAVVPLVLFNLLPRCPRKRIWVFRSRLLVPFLLSVFCIVVETLLNHSGALVWRWYYWRWPYVGVVISSYYVPFLVMAYAHDWLKKRRVRWSVAALGAVFVAFVICHFALPHSDPPIESRASTGGCK